MKTKFLLINLLLLFHSIDGSSQKIIKLAKNGFVSQVNYTSEFPFRYENKHIFIDVDVNGKTYNFLFDTGFDISAIDLNEFKNNGYKRVLKKKISGSSIEKKIVQFVEIPAIKIAEIDFNEIGAALMDLSFINKNYTCSENPVIGVIGANLLRKANWQIDYKNRIIIFSDTALNYNLSEKVIKIEMIPESWGSPSIYININGIQKKFTLDTGSGGAITTNTEFEVKLNLSNNKAKYVSITKKDSFNNIITNYYVLIDQIQVGNLNLREQIISLEKGVSSLIGNEFFENFTITFDWKNNALFLDSKKEMPIKNISDYEVILKPNYKNNKIEINGFYNNHQTNKNHKIGTEILTINNTNVSNLSTQELCNFWNNEWEKIKMNEKITIETGTEKIELVKIDLLKK